MRDDVLLDAIGKTVGQTLAKVRAELGLETDEKLKVVDELVRNHLIQYVKEYTDVASTSLTELLAEEVAALERKADEQGDAITLAQADYADKLVAANSEDIRNTLLEYINGQIDVTNKDLVDKINGVVAAVERKADEQGDAITLAQADYADKLVAKASDTLKTDLTGYINNQVADTHNTLHDKINDVVASIPEIRNGIDGVDGIDGKDGESVTGERGDDGVDGRDGLDRPIVEPVDLDRDISYPKGTTGSYEGGLWISSKESTGNPSSDPHAWSCILDSMSDLSVAVQEDRSYKLSIRMATGKVIDTSFDIPFPEHKGIWSEGEYLAGQIVTKGHSMWMAINDTAGSPPGNGWQQILTAPKGKTGPEGKSITGPQGVPGRNGRDGADAEIDWDIQKLFVEGIVYTDQRSASYPLRSFRGWYSEEESYLVGDVVRENNALMVVTQGIPAGSKYSQIAYDSTEVMFDSKNGASTVADRVPYMFWQGDYATGTSYRVGDTVKDGDWTMVSVSDDNTDRPAPQPLGDEFNLYTPDNTTTESATGTQIINGMRYLVETSAWLTGYRIFTVIGNIYDVYVVVEGQSSVLLSFTASEGGWTEFTVADRLLSVGETFDLVVIVRVPDPVPEIAFTGDWDYDTPGNPKNIGNGDAWQPDDDTDELWMSYTDDNGANRGAELLSTTIGDVIDVGDLRWSIQSITDEGNWVRFGISPQVQSGTTGVRSFQFETVPDTSLSYEREVDRWLNDDNISGLFGVDTPYSQIVADDNQYGVDIIVQQVSSSPCWEVVAGDGTSGPSAGGAQLEGDVITWATASATKVKSQQAQTDDSDWTEIGRRAILDGEGYRAKLTVSGKRTDATAYHESQYHMLGWNDGGNLITSVIKDFELGINLGFQVVEDGNEAVYQIRGKANQDWDWSLYSYYEGLA